MYKAKKLNRVVCIPDEKIGEYKELGYSIYEMDGTVVYEHKDDKQIIADLKKQIEALEKQLEAALKPKQAKTGSGTSARASAKTSKTE